MNEASNGSLSRRDIVVALAGTMALSACGGMGGSNGGSAMVSLGTTIAGDSNKELALWNGLAGTQFGAGGFGLTLVGVTAEEAEGKRPADLRQQPFLATFDVIQGGAMPGDQTYRITSAAVNPFEVFLTASATNPTRMYALFN